MNVVNAGNFERVAGAAPNAADPAIGRCRDLQELLVNGRRQHLEARCPTLMRMQAKLFCGDGAKKLAWNTVGLGAGGTAAGYGIGAQSALSAAIRESAKRLLAKELAKHAVLGVVVSPGFAVIAGVCVGAGLVSTGFQLHQEVRQERADDIFRTHINMWREIGCYRMTTAAELQVLLADMETVFCPPYLEGDKDKCHLQILRTQIGLQEAETGRAASLDLEPRWWNVPVPPAQAERSAEDINWSRFDASIVRCSLGQLVRLEDLIDDELEEPNLDATQRSLYLKRAIVVHGQHLLQLGGRQGRDWDVVNGAAA